MRKSFLKYIGGGALLFTVMFFGSCTEDFQDLNTDPNTYTEAGADNLFIMALNETIYTKGYFFSVANAQREALQFTSPNSGAPRTGNIGASAYGALYTSITYGEQIRSQLEGPENSVRRAITYIPQIYNAIRVSLKYGDIPYSEAGMARWGGSLYPKYDEGLPLFINLDTQLKSVVAEIEKGAGKSNLGFASWADYIYKGDITKWAKFANVLRLRIALTLAGNGNGANIAKAKEICADVAASASGIFENANDEYRFEVGKALDNPTDLPFLGGGEILGNPNKYLVNFLLNNQDPRLSMFIAPSPLTNAGVIYLRNMLNDPNANADLKDRINQLFVRVDTTQKSIPVLTNNIPTWRYVGTNPYVDQDKTGPDAILYKTFQFPSYNYVMPSGGEGRFVFSLINARLHNPNLKNADFFEEQNKNEANGQFVQPILPYSYMCFMLAQLDYLGVWSNPKGVGYAEWYSKGVEASIRMYDYIACKHRANPYKWNRTSAELDNAIQAYMSKDDVKLSGTGDWEKICLQQYFNCFHLTDLCADLVRMTGIPAKVSSLYPWAPREEFVNRRSALDRPSNETAEKNWLEAQNRQNFTPGVSTARILNRERLWWDLNSPDYGEGDILKTKK